MIKGSEKMEKEFSLFRKSAFGGFNRKDVISYIEKIRNESFEYRTQVENTVRDLNEKILELENAASHVMKNDGTALAVSDVNKVHFDEGCSGDISRATKHLKTVADELCRSLGEFIEKLSSKGLIDEVGADLQSESPEAFGMTEDNGDFASDMFSSFGFVCDSDTEIKPAVTEVEVAADDLVSDILSGLSFLK